MTTARPGDRIFDRPDRRHLPALSSLYKHLVRHGHAPKNPVGEVERPAIDGLRR
jgi:site-specific recombinase XerD